MVTAGEDIASMVTVAAAITAEADALPMVDIQAVASPHVTKAEHA